MSQAAVARAQTRATGPWFYAGMAMLSVLVAVTGFLPTFFVPLATGAFVRPPIFFVHGLLFFAWPVYVAVQAALVAQGRTWAHRQAGIFGAGLAVAMAFSVAAVVVARLGQQLPVPPGAPGSPQFAWVDARLILFFEAAVLLALANVRRPEIHKRLMLLATLSLLSAPIARWTTVLFGPAPPAGFAGFLWQQWPAFATDALMLLPMAYDWRTRGRVSAVWLVGAGLYAALGFTDGWVGFSAPWLAVADWLRGVARL